MKEYELAFVGMNDEKCLPLNHQIMPLP